jgi:hypothetical protein
LSCTGEGCLAPVNPPPVFGAPASATITGVGNLAPVQSKPVTKAKTKKKKKQKKRKTKQKARAGKARQVGRKRRS